MADASSPPVGRGLALASRRRSYERVPLLDAVGLEGRVGVTFFGMGRGYRDDPTFQGGVPVAVALDERPKEAV